MSRPFNPRIKVLGIAAGVVALLVVSVAVLAASKPEGDPFPFGTPEEFLTRVRAAIEAQGGIGHVTGETSVTNDGQTRPLWSSMAWFDFPGNTVRSSLTRAPGSGLDVPHEILELRINDDVYVAYPGSGEPTKLMERHERPTCVDPGPSALVIGLLCGFGPIEGEWELVRTEGRAGFRSMEVRSLAAYMNDGRVLRLLVDPVTFLPVAQTMTVEGEDYVIETLYRTVGIERGALAPDFFQPRGVGYVEEDEHWLRILEDTDLGVEVYWPGRALIGAGQFDAVLTAVADRRSGAESPGHVLTLTYEGNAGWFRLDYWPSGSWEAFRRLLGTGFLWSTCSSELTSEIPSGVVRVLRGFEAEAPPGPATPQVGARRQQPAWSDPGFDLFPDGCPDGPYSRFMAVARINDTVVTINAPYGYCCQDGAAFGVYNTQEAMLAIAESLRLRQPAE